MISLLPRENWQFGFGDFFRSLVAAISPRRRSNMIYIPRIGDCIAIRSGRAAFVTAINSLSLARGSIIGVPLYCCPIVFGAISATGCLTRFIDIDPETYCMSMEDFAAKKADVDAVVAVHMFGNLCDMANLRELANGIPIIEDCAQALGSDIDGRAAGTLGDISFFSFRSGKILTAGEGGALYSDDRAIFLRASQLVDDMHIPSPTEEFSHIFKVYLKSALHSRPLYGLAGYRLWSLVNKKANLAENPSVALSRVFKSDFSTVIRRAPLIGAIVRGQRINSAYYSKNLEINPDMICEEKPGTYYNRYHFPIVFPSTEFRDSMAYYLYERGIDSIRYLDRLVDIAKRNYEYRGDCPVTGGTFETSLNNT